MKDDFYKAEVLETPPNKAYPNFEVYRFGD
jgi:hypothetical protein